MYMEPATFCWAECIRYFLFSSTCRVRRSLVLQQQQQQQHSVCLTEVFEHMLSLPGGYQSRWQGFLLFPLWAWLSSPFAVSRSEPHPPPSLHRTRTGRTKQKMIIHTWAQTLLVYACAEILQDLPGGSAGRWSCGWCSLLTCCEGGPGGGSRSLSSPPLPRFYGCSGRMCWWGGTGSGRWSTDRNHQTSSCRRGQGEEKRRGSTGRTREKWREKLEKRKQWTGAKYRKLDQYRLGNKVFWCWHGIRLYCDKCYCYMTIVRNHTVCFTMMGPL